MKSKTFRIIVLVVGLVGIAVCCILGFTKKACMHTVTEWQETAATCTIDGEKARICKHCGKKLESEVIPALGHTGTWIEDEDNPRNCGFTDGSQYMICELCGEYLEKIIPSGHYWVDGVCKYCGEVKETQYKEFGSYPQKVVKDAALIDELNALAPVDFDTFFMDITPFPEGWTMAVYNLFAYTDVEYNGAKYRGCIVRFTTCTAVTWFSYEPIIWKVLRETEETYILQAANAIECKAFESESEDQYTETTLSKWLNGEFIQEAFTQEESACIRESTLDVEYIGDPNGITTRVYILSEEELTSGLYGFSENYYACDEERNCLPTQYVLFQDTGYTDAYAISAAGYWTRDIYWEDSELRGRQCYGGCLGYWWEADTYYIGVVPVIQVDKSFFGE